MFGDPTAEDLRALGIGRATWRDLGLDPSALEPEVRQNLERALRQTAMVAPEEIRFTQRSVSPQTSDGIRAADLAATMRDGGWRGGPVHGVRWGDGTLTSLDNRRLRAARDAGLERVPFCVHSPSERLDAWPQDWPADRRERNALGVDIRELPDGRWVVGGDEGRIVYARGTVPQTFGEIALFRAAEQRSLLPGHLFGADIRPVLLAKPELRTFEVSDAEAAVLDGLRGQAEMVADAVQAELESVGRRVTQELGLSQAAELTKTESRIKTAESLARKYLTDVETKGVTLQRFAAQVNDVLRFTMRLPSGTEYAPALERVLAELERVGYRVEQKKNFWAPGNRYLGVNTTLRTPSGQPFELQFHTDLSLRAGALTHDAYEVVRRDDESPARRVHAFLAMMAVNKRLGITDAIPPGLGEAIGNGFTKWICREADMWHAYREWLELNERSFLDIAAEFGLGPGDFVVSPSVAEKLEQIDADLLRHLQVGD